LKPTHPEPLGQPDGVVVPEPEVPDAVDLGELVRVEEPAKEEAAVDERGPFVALRRNRVDPADPGGLVRVDLQGPASKLVSREAQDLAGRVGVGSGRDGGLKGRHSRLRPGRRERDRPGR